MQNRLHSLALSFVLLSLFVGSTAHAQLRSHDVRFIPPADARVVGFHVYVSANSMSYADWRDDVNFIPPVDGAGAATFRLTGLEAFDDVYLTMKSYDGSGVESGFSNEIVLPAQAQCTVGGCSDGNACTRDTCTTAGCVFDPAPLLGTTCNDGNASTHDDVCSASGVCAGTLGQCNVDADCGASSNPCGGPRVCSNHTCVDGAPRADGTTCNDGSASTRYDVCESGTCRGYACGSDAHCGDGEACNGAERCLNRSCVAGTPLTCGDGNVCNGSETCRNSTCVAGTAMQCSLEGGPCFDAFCDPALGCRVETHPDGTTCTTSASSLAGQCASGLCVANAPPPPDDEEEEPTTCDTAYGPPSLVHQVLSATPETSRKIVWSAPLHPLGAVLEYRLRGASAWTSLRAAPESSSGCGAVWSATLTGLNPNAFYDYRVSGSSAQGPVMSDVYAVRTGSAATGRRFKFAFLAGNGLGASPQSTQALNVLERVDLLGYPLVLGGGGYALSKEAIAAGAAPNAAAAVAAWKRQAGRVTANSIFAPVLGDSEVESYMHDERAADYAEFMRSPAGGAPRSGSYSFDFNGTHFVALHAPGLGAVHPSTAAGVANLAWLETDLAAARAAGARWIVVYMHADVFSTERVEAETTGVRKALGAILQRHGVNLVLSGDATSFERSKALRGPLEDPIPGPIAWRISTATDGIVFVRAGSGGRTAFGSWVLAKPDWTAFRNNSRAVYVSVIVTEWTLRVASYGLDANGMRTVVDAIEIR
ncbi:MAG: metallophosphoesterase family protein [Myxococcota bacterium]